MNTDTAAMGLSPREEIVARSDAAFDGRDFDALGRADKKRYLDRAAAGIAALSAIPGEGELAPKGWRTLPTEPTEAMISRGLASQLDDIDLTPDEMAMFYREMLAAAPPVREAAPSDSEMAAALEEIRDGVYSGRLCAHDAADIARTALSNRPATGGAVDAEGMRERAAKVAEGRMPEPDGAPDCKWTHADTLVQNACLDIATDIRSLPLTTEGE